jgi:hypothetical protein
MQLIGGITPLVMLCACACEPGGISVQQPLPPDAAEGGTGLDSSPTSGAGTGPGGGGLDDDGLDDGGLDDDGPADPTGSAGEGGDGPSVLIPSGSTWQIASSAPPDWTLPSFDDAAWTELEAPLGTGYEVSSPWSSDGGATYLRHRFDTAIDPDDVLELRVRRDDGAIAYLDGVEVGRWNVEPGTAGANASVIDEVEDADGYTYLLAVPPPPASAAGPHVLAIEVHQRNDADLVFDARLRRIGATTPIETIPIQARTRSYNGNYAPENVGAIWIEDAEGTFVRSLVVWGSARREHLVAWSASSQDDRVDAITSATAASHHSRLIEWDLRDASGQLVPAGDYIARFEFTEANSNEGAAAGPTASIPFSTLSRCQAHTGGNASIDEILVVTPCP